MGYIPPRSPFLTVINYICCAAIKMMLMVKNKTDEMKRDLAELIEEREKNIEEAVVDFGS